MGSRSDDAIAFYTIAFLYEYECCCAYSELGCTRHLEPVGTTALY